MLFLIGSRPSLILGLEDIGTLRLGQRRALPGGDPEQDGVGLARLEFIVAEHIKVHPMALVQPQRIDDAAVRAQIEKELVV